MSKNTISLSVKFDYAQSLVEFIRIHGANYIKKIKNSPEFLQDPVIKKYDAAAAAMNLHDLAQKIYVAMIKKPNLKKTVRVTLNLNQINALSSLIDYVLNQLGCMLISLNPFYHAMFHDFYKQIEQKMYVYQFGINTILDS